jgi:hypothetical protein
MTHGKRLARTFYGTRLPANIHAIWHNFAGVQPRFKLRSHDGHWPSGGSGFYRWCDRLRGIRVSSSAV